MCLQGCHDQQPLECGSVTRAVRVAWCAKSCCNADMRGVRHWGGCDWHVAGGSRARVWGRGEVFPRGEPRSHPEVSPRGENLRCRYFGTVPQIVGGNGLPGVRDCARYRGDVRPCWVQPIYTMSDTSRGRQRGARTRGGAARGAAPTADPGGAPGTANPMQNKKRIALFKKRIKKVSL